MEAKPGIGVGKLVFGMRGGDVKPVLGEPSKILKDDEGNVVWQYDSEKLRLTFYTDEELRLGYIISANPELTMAGIKIIGAKTAEVKSKLPKQFKTWEVETYDITENHFNEDNWIILQSEFGEVVKLEIGAAIEDDEFVWKFK